MTQNEFLSAHTGWMRADLMRQELERFTPKDLILESSFLTKPPAIYFCLFFAFLFTVLEFLREKGAIPENVREDVNLIYDKLRLFRNAVFHLQDQFAPDKLAEITRIPGITKIVWRIHFEVGAFLCDDSNRPEI